MKSPLLTTRSARFVPRARPTRAKRIALLPQITFAFHGDASSTQEVTLIKYLPVQGFVSGVFELRCLQNGVLDADQRLLLLLRPVSRAEDDPATLYAASTGEAGATIGKDTLPLETFFVALPQPLPAFYSLVVVALQAGTPTQMGATVSASLLLRPF